MRDRLPKAWWRYVDSSSIWVAEVRPRSDVCHEGSAVPIWSRKVLNTGLPKREPVSSGGALEQNFFSLLENVEDLGDDWG